MECNCGAFSGIHKHIILNAPFLHRRQTLLDPLGVHRRGYIRKNLEVIGKLESINADHI